MYLSTLYNAGYFLLHFFAAYLNGLAVLEVGGGDAGMIDITEHGGEQERWSVQKMLFGLVVFFGHIEDCRSKNIAGIHSPPRRKHHHRTPCHSIYRNFNL
jgi:hypothetical protein